MYQIDINLINNQKIFIFHGQIDSTNADEVGNILANQVAPGDDVIFDFEDVNYISSAGLRLVLKYAKCSSKFECINVSAEVYEIFDMTGFTQIITVKRALRVVSIEGKEMIGEGYMGRVYRINDDTIIKVFYRDSTVEDIKREIDLAKKAFVLGIPTAIPFDVVKVKEGGYGSIFELLSSNCFNKLFAMHPENEDRYVKMYIDLLKEMMKIRIEDKTILPNKKNEALLWLKEVRNNKVFEPRVLDKLEKLIDTIPDDNHLIHGDYHIKNIMMQGEEPLLIDMDTLGVGHEIFEITAFFLTYIGYPATAEGNSEWFLGVPDRVSKRLFYDTINEIYKDHTEKERKEIIDKCSILGYMWLAYKTITYEPENKVRYEHSVQQVLNLIDDYHTLAF